MDNNDKNWVDYKEIKRTVTMEMILEHYGFLSELKNSGKNLSGCCPIHKGSNPRQFSVSTEKNIWNCFGNCKTGGNILDFVALVEFENKEMESIRKAALLLKDWFLSDNSPELKKQPTKPSEGKKLVRKEKQSAPEKSPKEEVKPEISGNQASPPVNPPLTFRLKSIVQDHPFFGQRGILPQTVNDFGLGFCTKGMMKDRIAIPIHDEQGNLVAYCGRAVTAEQIENEEKYKLPPNFTKSAVVYNLHRQPPKADLFILVESYFSVFALHQANYSNALSLMGSFLSEAQEELIVGRLAPDGKLLLFFDNDEDGHKCACDCLERLSRRVFVKVLDVGIFGKKPHHLKPEDLKILIG
jgi:DNA primase